MALAHVIRSDPQIGIRVLQEVSTDPVHNMHYFVINTNDTKRFDELVDADHTVEVAERVPSYESEPVYRVEFSPETILLSRHPQRAVVSAGVKQLIESSDIELALE